MPLDRFTLSAVLLVVDVAPGVLLAQALLRSLEPLSLRCGVILRRDGCCDESKYPFLPVIGKPDASVDELTELLFELRGRTTLPAAVTWDRPRMPVSTLVLLATGVTGNGGAAVVAIGTAGERVVPVCRSPATPVCAFESDFLDTFEQLRGNDCVMPTLANLFLVGVGTPYHLPCVDPIGK